MAKFIEVKKEGTKYAINIEYITNVCKISDDTIYIDYYTNDPNKKYPYIIEREEISYRASEIYDNILRCTEDY